MMIVAELNGRSLGVLVDAVGDIVRVEGSSLHTPPRLDDSPTARREIAPRAFA